MNRILTPPVGAVALLLGMLAAGGFLRAQEQDADVASALLEAAIQRQWVGGDLAGAIRQYEAILTRFSEQRQIAAQALWRLGQAQEQIGRVDDARRSYQRLTSQHADETALVGAARTRLAGLAESGVVSEPELSLAVAVEMYSPKENPPWSAGNTSRQVVFSDLAVYDPRNGETRRLKTNARSAAYPVLSPNGYQVAYLSWNDLTETQAPVGLPIVPASRRSDPSGSASAVELRVVGLNGIGDRLVTRGDADTRWLRPFVWSSDGRAVLTLFERASGLRQIGLVTVATGETRVLKSLPGLAAQDMSLSQDGHFAVYQAPAARGAAAYDFVILPATDVVSAAPERRYSIALGGQRGVRPSDDELAIHVLNRTGFGPRLGDIERVKAVGIDAYIDEQLHPERIADPVVDAKLAGFRSLRMEIPELLEKAGPVVAIAERRRASIFERPALVARTEAAAKAPGADLAARTSGEPRIMNGPDRPNDTESHTARIIRAVHSQRQLHEVMVDFWMNHFNINLGDDQLVPSFEEQVIRQHALGSFERMLSAVAHHPKMLEYLDNWRSSAPAEVVEQRRAEIRKTGDLDGQLAALERDAFFKETKGLNENYARELLELHTMGVDSGYTQQDIIEVAKILTGWTVGTRGFVNAREGDGVFWFDPVMHVEGDKVVLGQTFPSGGVEEGEALLKMLAARPETARFISTKLARRFIADDPPEAVVEEASRTFLRTGGDIREVVRTILMSPQFRASGTIRAKIKKPFELVVSALRAVDATFQDSNHTFEDLDAYGSLVGGNNNLIARMGERMYNYQAPDGNPDVGPAWMNSNALLLRLEFANALASNRIPGITSNLASAEKLLSQMGVARPTPQQIAQHRAMLQAAAAPAPGTMSAERMMMAGGQPAASVDAPAVDPVALTVAAMLGSPQFQKR